MATRRDGPPRRGYADSRLSLERPKQLICSGATRPGVTEPHAVLDLDEREVLVELHRHERAVGLLHVRLVRRITGIGLQPDDRAARYGGERGSPRFRGVGAGEHLLVRADRSCTTRAGRRGPWGAHRWGGRGR